MSDYRRKANNGMNTTEQTAAQWAVDGRVFDVNCVLVPTDGPDQGKHKLADGIHIYNDLSFVEDGGGGGGSVTANQQAALNASNSPSGSNRYVTASDLVSDNVGMSTFFFATVNGVRSLYIEVFQGVDPPNRYWSVNGVESVDNAIFGTSGAWVVNVAGNTDGGSTDAVANPTLVTTWTGSATVVVEPVLYGPTVQDALEQLAATQSIPRRYRVLLTQTSTDAPSLTVLLNELGGSPVASYVSPGVYRITLSGAFDPDKTLAIISNNTGDGAAFSIVSAYVDASGNYIEIVTGTGESNLDEILNKTPLLIEVYP